ncbi:hypothetical protein A5875_001520, partial [Enterococcus sp. 3H8_DIV0648]
FGAFDGFGKSIRRSQQILGA